MESKAAKLPIVFKLSLLSKIMPYFGYLHEWKTILELISKKTRKIWNDNTKIFMYCGRDQRFNVHYFKNDSNKTYVQNILKNAELFDINTECFFNFHHDNSCTKDIKFQVIECMFTPFLKLLNIANAMVIDRSSKQYHEIIFCTQNEAEDILYSSLCSSPLKDIKIFDSNQRKDLLKYISEKVKYRRIVIRNCENNLIEVLSIFSNWPWYSENYNILNEEVKVKLNSYYSCTAFNCACKPNSLCIMRDSTSEMSKETINEILKLSVLENVTRLKINPGVREFSSIDNLCRILQRFPKLRICFNLHYKYSRAKLLKVYNIKLDSNVVNLISNDKILSLENNYGSNVYIEGTFSEFKPIIIENLILIKCTGIYCRNIELSSYYNKDIEIQGFMDEIKKTSKTNDALFIVADINTLRLNIKPKEIDKYIPISRYFKLINIKLTETTSNFKEEVEEINKLYKQCNICVNVINLYDFVNSDALNQIDLDFNRILIQKDHFRFKFIKCSSSLIERKFEVYDNMDFNTKSVDIDKLKEIVSRIAIL